MPNSTDRPNVVVFFTDQQRWDTTGVHGNPMGLTPNFDEFARKGTDVHYSFTCQPVCGPARSCMQTGQYPTQTGVYRNGISLQKDARTMAKSFRDAGYNTGYIGKWHLYEGSQGIVPQEERQGYQYWLASNLLEFDSLPYSTTVYDNDNQEVYLPGHRVDALTDAAIRKITDWKDQPFFLFLSHIEPHHQNQHDNHPAPDGYEIPYRSAVLPPDLAALGGTSYQHLPGYYGMVRKLDEAFGRLLDALKSLNLSENTIVLFSSDHGCHFKTRNAEYKRSVHDSSLRVPTAINGPMFKGGGRVSKLVNNVDIAPTLLDSCGIEVPETMEGSSLVPIVSDKMNGRLSNGKNQSTAREHNELFFQTSEDEVARGLRTHRWKYAVVGKSVDPRIDGDAEQYTEAYLYDLEADPFELDNLVSHPSHQAVRDYLRGRLLQWILEIENVEPVIERASPPETSKMDKPAHWGGISQRELFEGEAYE